MKKGNCFHAWGQHAGQCSGRIDNVKRLELFSEALCALLLLSFADLTDLPVSPASWLMQVQEHSICSSSVLHKLQAGHVREAVHCMQLQPWSSAAAACPGPKRLHTPSTHWLPLSIDTESQEHQLVHHKRLLACSPCWCPAQLGSHLAAKHQGVLLRAGHRVD